LDETVDQVRSFEQGALGLGHNALLEIGKGEDFDSGDLEL